MTQLYLFSVGYHVPTFVFTPFYAGVIVYLLFLVYKNRKHSGLKKLIIILLSLIGVLFIGTDLSSVVVKLSIFTTPFLVMSFQRMSIVKDGLKLFSGFMLILWGMTLAIDVSRIAELIDSFWYSALLILEMVLIHFLLIAYFCYACKIRSESVVSGISQKEFGAVLYTIVVVAVSAGAVIISGLSDRCTFFFITSFAALIALHVLLVYFEYRDAFSMHNYASHLHRGQGEEHFLKDGDCSEETAILLRLVQLFDKEKLYLNPEITVAEVAAKIYTNRTYLSRALNKRTSKNFSQFVNYYRVKEVCRLFITTPEVRMQQLSEQCGFNTASSFASAFRLNTGYTPVDWGKEVRRKQASSERVSIEDYIL